MSQRTNAQKIIFLDFDGVLQIEKYSDPWKGQSPLLDGYTDRDKYGLLFDKSCVAHLEQLIAKTGAKVVISSSWRFDGEKTMFHLWKDRQMPGELIGITAYSEIHWNVSRGLRIQDWLDQHSVNTYVILDDVDEMLEEQKSNFVLTDYKLGFQKDELQKAIRILNQEPTST